MNWSIIGLLAICLAAISAEAKWDRILHGRALNSSYDAISKVLERDVATDDAETNMFAIEQMLVSSKWTMKKALKQIVALKSVLKPDSCSEVGTDIVTRNDFACRERAYKRLTNSDKFERRIDALVHHYALQHSLVCDQVYQKNCLNLVKNVDEETYRKVFGLSSAFYYSESKQQLNALVEEMKLKKVGDSLVTAHILEKNQERPIETPYGFDWDSTLIWKYLKAVVANEKGKNYTIKILYDEIHGLIPDPKVVTDLYNEYVKEPCRKFLNVMRPTMKIYNHNRRIIPANQQTADLEFRFLNRAVYSCKEIFTLFDGNLRNVLDESRDYETL